MWLVPIVTVIVGVLAPVLTMMGLLHRSRSEVLNSINDQLGHVDKCVDDLKVKVVGYAAMAVTRDEMDATLTRMRLAMAGEIHAIEGRVVRLENRFLLSHE